MKAQECKSEDLGVTPAFSAGKSLTSLGLRVSHLKKERGDLLGEGLCLLILNSISLRHMKTFVICENIFDLMLFKKYSLKM